ncbi:MAG TPA: tetratricopeptide repeat protein [Planctomycetota bacterium]|jgi:tetratricopeptide (TPR) repeat protein|nr:tetratricopeptide repeat protein [Planctomycetota bacterium]
MRRFYVEAWIAALALCASAARAGAEVPRQADARAQIRYAASIRREGRGLKGDERIDHLKRVAAGFEAVAAYFPESKSECAEALFRLGEVRRTLGDRAGAVAAFEGVVANGSHRRFAARALLEIGNVRRRAKEGAKALEAYARVVEQYPDEKGYRDDAWMWTGNVHAAARNHEAARAAWLKVAEEGEDPVDRIRAYDRIAGSHLVEGKNAEAASTLERCRAAFAELAEEPTSRGSRVKRALAGMKSAAKIADALAKTNREAVEEDPEEEGEGPGG